MLSKDEISQQQACRKKQNPLKLNLILCHRLRIAIKFYQITIIENIPLFEAYLSPIILKGSNSIFT